MRKNLELKAEYASSRRAMAICRHIGAHRGGILRQTDTYFGISEGRIKLREINSKEFELIYYRRANRLGSRFSDYIVVPLKRPEPAKELCARIFGLRTSVKKVRRLYLFRNARIHIDSVARLGTFLEFEVIVERGRRQAKNLMKFLIDTFEIPRTAIVGVSYSDLLMKQVRRKGRKRVSEKALAKRK